MHRPTGRWLGRESRLRTFEQQISNVAWPLMFVIGCRITLASLPIRPVISSTEGILVVLYNHRFHREPTIASKFV